MISDGTPGLDITFREFERRIWSGEDMHDHDLVASFDNQTAKIDSNPSRHTQLHNGLVPPLVNTDVIKSPSPFPTPGPWSTPNVGETTEADLLKRVEIPPLKPKAPTSLQNVLRTLPSVAADRKNAPVMTGVVDYFPLAIAEVARISKAGNDQHNPDQPLHWARHKSGDHADCIVRHLIERGTLDTDGQRHTAKAAWRALALLQEELEAEAGWKPKAAA